MPLLMRLGQGVTALATVILLSHCAIATYPGQPGMVSNSYVKIDLEDLEEPGLFVYETVYDNRPSATGVGAIITKLYPKAQTYTSNVRTNADGTLYRSKAQYDGAEVQAISVPSSNQIHLSPNNQIAMLIDYANSLDEIDDKNAAELGLFKPSSMPTRLPSTAYEFKKMRWDILRAGTLTKNGSLAYEVTSVDFNGTVFTPKKSVKVETSLFQNGVHSDLSKETKSEFTQFLEANFPKGFNGTAKLKVKGSEQPLSLKIGLNTIKTAETSGIRITKDATEAMAQEIINRFKAVN